MASGNRRSRSHRQILWQLAFRCCCLAPCSRARETTRKPQTTNAKREAHREIQIEFNSICQMNFPVFQTAAPESQLPENLPVGAAAAVAARLWPLLREISVFRNFQNKQIFLPETTLTTSLQHHLTSWIPTLTSRPQPNHPSI